MIEDEYIPKEKLELFGYIRGDKDTLHEVDQISICIDSGTARMLGEFFLKAHEQMKENPHWDHIHFNAGGFCDVIASKNRSV